MTKKPIIGIIARPVLTSENHYGYIAFEEIRQAIILAGGIPISILPTDERLYSLDIEKYSPLIEQEKNDLKRIISLCDGLVLQGGSKWYLYDEFIASYAIENDIPTFGICLGMQLLNFIDTNEKPILKKTVIDHNQKEQQIVHKITIDTSSLLFSILKKNEVMVNSRHQYSILKVKKFKIAALSPDNIIEAIYHPKKKFILGVQFHPESMIKNNSMMLDLFKYFIKTIEK